MNDVERSRKMKNKNIPEKKDGVGKRAGRPPSAETVNEMKFTVVK